MQAEALLQPVSVRFYILSMRGGFNELSNFPAESLGHYILRVICCCAG